MPGGVGRWLVGAVLAFGVASTGLHAGAFGLPDRGPTLLPGEGLAFRSPEGVIRTYGDVGKEQPMGSLAKLLWLRLEGASWSARSVTYTCTGSMGPWHCWNREGHGKVDLEKASERSCNLAFLSWILESDKVWRATMGEASARARLEVVFSPFLGSRLKSSEGLPAFSPEWIGDGELLRTTPEGMLAWLLEPAQVALLRQCQLLLALDPKAAGKEGGLWVKTGTAPVPGVIGETSAWAVGGQGHALAVLHLPRGRGKEEGLARFRQILEQMSTEPWVAQGPGFSVSGSTEVTPDFKGAPDTAERLEDPLQAALRATEAFGPLPSGHWTIWLHEDASAFEVATGAPPARAGTWVGTTLHLRPWEQLQRRDLGAILRHELVHRRLKDVHLRSWEEEARCLCAEGHVRPPKDWPSPPPRPYQDRLDRALSRGVTAEQAWAYRAIRAWLAGQPLPTPGSRKEATKGEEPWEDDAPSSDQVITLSWPSERLPRDLEVNGTSLERIQGRVWHFDGRVTFGKGAPFKELVGHVEAIWTASGWKVSWLLPATTWVAAATAGEMGDEAPFEARRALASVLRLWLNAHPNGNHPDGTFCPLTHCAVVRGIPSASTLRAAVSAPTLTLDPSQAVFCGSKGGISLSTREVWGGSFESAPPVPRVPGDRWVDWERHLSPSQVQKLKAIVKPGLKPGQKGFRIGASGPYPVEDLRLATGRAFGWTLWPSNACEVENLKGGGLIIRGHGWGHNAGMCLATALYRARECWKAEQILDEAFSTQ